MKSYLKFLSRNKLYTAIEAVGLVLSLAFVIILGSYAWQQYAAAHSTPDGDRVYALGMPDYLGLTYGMPELIKERVPEVETVGIYCPGLVMQMKQQDEVEEVSSASRSRRGRRNATWRNSSSNWSIMAGFSPWPHSSPC